MNNSTIRIATLDDYDTICNLLKESDEHHAAILPDYFRQHSQPSRARDWMASYVESDDAEVLLAETESRTIGCMMLKTIALPKFPRFIVRCMVNIEEIVVASESRGCGFATALLNEAKAWAIARKITRLQLGVWVANTDAVRFYKKKGFKTITARMELDLDA